ncbi:MAG: exodeoxyribonuclease VII large subunit [Ruminococcaceae bacterium]|nr:exodeoxyribonuclease VII large subunit [Oscillospiraceae bacterium]
MEQQVLSITQINEYIRSRMDADPLLGAVAVRGEISNYKMYPSGHHYFTLKDEGGALKCVMFKGNAVRLRFRPDNGMKVIAMGKISVFPRDGAYQLYCSSMAMDGVGDLYAAFEQLKAQLAEQGLFDPAHKKPLPKYPGVIGIVTSSAGAAVHDMLRILRKRYPLTKVRLFPVRVQGAEAPPEIVGAIRYANRFKLADLLIVGRGGGSIEDLWAFNDERVARAIYESEIPVISAVGHEPDVTISDYVADLRAATPSNGAELAVQDQDALRQVLDSFSATMVTCLTRQIKSGRQHLRALSASPTIVSPVGYLNQRRQGVLLLHNRLISSQTTLLEQRRRRFVEQAAKLDAMSPLKVLTRGYAITQADDGEIIRSVSQVRVGQNVEIKLNDGSLAAAVTQIKENCDE